MFQECVLETASRHLIFHGALVLLVALLYGAPYARAIKSGASAQVVNSWRVAHQSLTLGALLMFSIAAILPTLLVPVGLKWLISVSLISLAYAFAIATPLAAITQDRGLASGGRGLARLVYWGNITGAWTSLVAAISLVFAAAMSL
jgi:hypothetical protein